MPSPRITATATCLVVALMASGCRVPVDPPAPAPITLAGELVHTLDGAAFKIAWSPDGTRVAGLSRNAVAWIWDAATGDTLHTLSVGGGVLAWSPDGTHLATGGSNRDVVIWDAATGEAVHTLPTNQTGYYGGVYDASWSPDGTRIAATGGYSNVWIWDTATGETVNSVTVHTPLDGVYYDGGPVAWSPDGTRVAFGGAKLWVWTVETDETVYTDQFQSVISTVVWSQDGTRLATIVGDRTARIWHPSTMDLDRAFNGFNSLWLAWSPDSSQLALSDYEADAVHIVDTSTGESTLSLPASGVIEHVAWSPRGDLIAASNWEGSTALVWDAVTGELGTTIALPGNDSVRDWRSTQVAWSPDGERLAITSNAGVLIFR